MPGGLYDFAIAIYSSTVTIEENIAPTVGALTASGGGSDGWFGSGGQLAMSGSDTLGIRRFEVLEGGAVVGTVQRTCVDWSVLPCSEPAAGLTASASASTTLASLALSDGAHQLRVRAVDAAGNGTLSAPLDIAYDATPRIAGGFVDDGLSASPTRTLGWALSGGGAPATSAVARVCVGPTADPADCADRPVPPLGPLALELADGANATVQITTTDAAGNVGTSGTARLSRDATAPAAPSLNLTNADGPNRTVDIAGEGGARIDAQLCTVADARTCTALARPAALGPLTVALPTPGSYDLLVTLTDAAGNTSAPGTLRLTRAAALAEPKALNLTVRVASNLRKRRITINGSVAPGSTKRINVALTAATRRGRRVTARIRITVPANGRFNKRIRLPAKATSTRPVRLVFTPAPEPGWRITRYSHTIRP